MKGRRRARAIVAGAILVLLVVALARREREPVVKLPPVPARATILQDDALLLHRSTGAVDAALGRIRSLGVDWVRVTAGWSVIAPEPHARVRPDFDAADPGAYPGANWQSLDRLITLARRHGLQVIIDIAFWAPRWAVRAELPATKQQRWAPDPNQFALFAAAVAERYSGRYGGLPPAVAFTIWNEPNYGLFLLPQRRRVDGRFRVVSADVYRRMLYAAYPRIKRASPGALVLIGATAWTGIAHPGSTFDGVPPLRFARELACVSADLRPLHSGGCAHFKPLPGDGWAHHPYSPRRAPSVGDPNPDDVTIADLGHLTTLLAQLHARGRTQTRLPVYITEYGYETNPPDPTQPVSLAQQARYLPEAELLAYSNPDVRSFAQFELRDLAPRPGRTLAQRWGDFQSGLELPDGTPKPALEAFRAPLVVRPLPGGRVSVWGHIRPGHGVRRVRLLVRRGERGPWLPLPGGRIRTDPNGYFTLVAPGRDGALYRLELGRRGGWAPLGIAVRAG